MAAVQTPTTDTSKKSTTKQQTTELLAKVCRLFAPHIYTFCYRLVFQLYCNVCFASLLLFCRKCQLCHFDLHYCKSTIFYCQISYF